MKKFAKVLRFVLGRNWVMPVVALVGSAISCACQMGMCAASVGVDVETRHILGMLFIPVQIVQILLFLGLPLWLLVITVMRLIRHQHHVWWAWLWSALAGGGMVVCLATSSFAAAFAYCDDFALEHRLPDEMTPANTPGMAVPLGFSFYTLDADKMSPAEKAWKNLLPADSGMCISGDEHLTDAAPNVEKLAAEAPDLLLEYKLRAACYMVLTPGVKVAPHLDLLRHAGEHLLCATDQFEHEDDLIWHKQLPNGWNIFKRSFSSWGDKKVPSVFDLKALQQLDEGLAALATNPTRAGLDALLPPLPDKPVIVLREGFQPGMYSVVLLVPLDYPEGTFQLKACEYTRKTPLSMPPVELAPEPYREFCKLAVSDDFTVYSGEWGELYASTWELHFTPAEGGESRCVNSQLYLMQGWSR